MVGILSVYCVIPMRLLLETRRKGLELPKPPGAAKMRKTPAGARPARQQAAQPGPGGAGVDAPGSPARRSRERSRGAGRLPGVLGIGVLLGIGGLLFILGMGKASSGQLGLLLIGFGGFLMLLSVTLPTFKIVDIMVRAIGRMVIQKRARRRLRGRPRRDSREPLRPFSRKVLLGRKLRALLGPHLCGLSSGLGDACVGTLRQLLVVDLLTNGCGLLG